MTTIYGPAEAWFLEGRGSVAEIDDANKAIDAAPGLTAETDRLAQADAANISGAVSILGRYRPELSNGGAVDVSQMRVWEVLIFQVRPDMRPTSGREPSSIRARWTRQKSTFLGRPTKCSPEMPGPTYLVFLPHRTLSEIHPATGAGAALEKAFNEESIKKLSSLAEGYSSVEEMVFSVSPQMSYLSSEFVARDPKFWTRKPPAAKRQLPESKPQQ